LIANSLLALAEAYFQNGSTVEALQAAIEAAETFSRLGTLDLEWIAWSISARASQSAGQTQKAKEYAERAQTALASLEQQWGTNYYNSYLNRLDIQFYRKWLSGIPLSKP
jgi:tetratricopeptide (TPR) repeat protein